MKVGITEWSLRLFCLQEYEDMIAKKDFACRTCGSGEVKPVPKLDPVYISLVSCLLMSLTCNLVCIKKINRVPSSLVLGHLRPCLLRT